MNEKVIVQKIKNIYLKRRAVVYALALEYAAKALRSFQIKQRNGAFWNNQSKTAMNTMFTRAFIENNVIGFFMAHFVEYGPYLELANDGIHESIRPTMMIYASQFVRAVQGVFKDDAA